MDDIYRTRLRYVITAFVCVAGFVDVIGADNNVATDLQKDFENHINKGSVVNNELSLGKWNIISNLLIMLSKDIQFLKAQLDSIERQGHSMAKSVKQLDATCKSATGKKGKWCPTGFHLTRGKSCYSIDTSLVTSSESRDMCGQLNASVVAIESRGEQRYLVNQVRKNAEFGHCSFWAGASAAQHDGRWRWLHNGAPLSYSNWHRGEPNSGRVGENCLLLDWMFNWQWNDVQCNVIKACSICEYVMGEPDV